MPTFLALLGMFISVMLIGIILLQRGRGGGLVGALSGLGGQSAFGTKAGDTFTRITIGIAAAWVLLAGIHGRVLRSGTVKFKNETKEIGTPSKDKDSKKSDDSTNDLSGLGSLSDDRKDGGAKEKAGDSKKKSKDDKPVKEVEADDSKKSDVDNKKSDTDSKPKEPPKKELDPPADDKSGEKSGEAK